MDDFGNCYQTEEWFTHCTQYSASMATFGFADDFLHEVCVAFCIDYAAQEV